VRYYPTFLDLQGQRCIVLGEGELAAAKVKDLRDAGAEVEEIASADYRPGDLAGARLVVDASGDLEVNKATWAEAEAAGILVNVVDVPEKCRFIAPAIVHREPLLVAISTSGESPFLASALRARLERILGAEWGPFTALVGAVRRRLRARGVPLHDQLKTYQRLLASDVLSLYRAGAAEEAERVADLIASQSGSERPGRVALVGAGPGDPGLLTVAAQELLWRADLVLHDALVSPATLACCGPQAKLVDVGKRGGRRQTEQDSITARLIQEARAGREVVRLKGGDPFVFGRGGEELADLVAAGIDVVVVPGVSSVMAGPAAAGIPLTLRDVAATVGFTTGRVADGGADLEAIVRLAEAVDTLVVLMPLANLDALTAALATSVGPDRPAAAVAAATTPEQRVVRAKLCRIAAATRAEGLEAPVLLVVGEVVDALPKGRLDHLISHLQRTV